MAKHKRTALDRIKSFNESAESASSSINNNADNHIGESVSSIDIPTQKKERKKNQKSTPLSRIQNMHQPLSNNETLTLPGDGFTNEVLAYTNNEVDDIDCDDNVSYLVLDDGNSATAEASEVPSFSEQHPEPSSFVRKRGRHKKDREDKEAPASSAGASSPAPPIDYESMESALEHETILKERRERRIAKRQKIIERVSSVLLIVGCIYILFLIYGAFNTDYYYDEDGQINAQKMTIEQLRQLNEFDDVVTQYLQVRSLYEKILMLDHQLASGVIDPLLIAPEYTNLRSEIEKLTIQVSALEVSTKYENIQEDLVIITSSYMWTYCDNMSNAISHDNADCAKVALEARTKTRLTFARVTDNLSALADTVHGVENKDFYQSIHEWSPEKFINSAVGSDEHKE